MTDLPAELDLERRQTTLSSAVWAASDRVAVLPESALASVVGTLPGAVLSPEVASLSKLWVTSSTSMVEQSPWGVALTLFTAGPEPGAGVDPLDVDTAKRRVEDTNILVELFQIVSGFVVCQVFYSRDVMPLYLI